MEEKKPRPVKKPNRFAPRFRKEEFTHQVVNEDLYKRWKKETGNKMTFREFRDIWDKIADTIQEQVVNNPHGVRLPFYNGDLVSNYVTMLKRHMNKWASENAGYEIPELDWHSNRRPGKIIWSINHARKQHRWLILFAFAPCAKFRRKVSDGFKTHPEIYKLARTLAYIAHKQSK